MGGNFVVALYGKTFVAVKVWEKLHVSMTLEELRVSITYREILT